MPSPQGLFSPMHALPPALLAGLALVACALLAVSWAWWRQRKRLHAALREAGSLHRNFQLLQDQHALLTSVAHKSPLVPYRCEAQVGGAVLFVGDAIEVLTGWPADAFLQGGKRLDDIVHPTDLRRLRGQLARAFQHALSLRFECRLLHRDGRCFWVNGHGDLRRARDGQAFIEGAFLNIDERKALESRLHEREQLYSALIANMPGAAYRCTPDRNWTVLFISDAIEPLSGWAPADYLASPTLLREFVHVEDQHVVHELIQAMVAQGKGFTLEYRAVRRDGRQLWVREQGHAVRDSDGEVKWLEGVMVDISERKSLEISLRDAKEHAEVAAASKTMFLANMGHEVRTPLNAIIGFSEIVLKAPLDATQREQVYKVRQAARTLLRLVNDILDMANLQRGTLVLTTSDFSLRELAHEALQAQRGAADKKGLGLRLEADPALGDAFLGDAPRLRQMLDKLLDNAVKFTERGMVRLQLGMADGQVLLAVHDTGIGIAPDRQDRIFDAFTQADPSMIRRHGGAGLGATIARQLAERMGGSLRVHSTPGAGSCFRVLVPLAPAAPVRRGPALRDAVDDTGAMTMPYGQPMPVPMPQAQTGSLPQHPSLPVPLPLPLSLLPPLPGAGPMPMPVPVPLSSPPAVAGRQSTSQPEASAHASRTHAVLALRNGDHTHATLPQLLHFLREQGLVAQAVQVEHALAMFDLDLAAELLESLPAPL